MAVTTTIVFENAEYRDVEERDDTIGYFGRRREYKSGPEFNRAQQEDKIRQAIAVFSSNYANWATMTAAQKDTANRQAQRALANLCRNLLADFSSAGD